MPRIPEFKLVPLFEVRIRPGGAARRRALEDPVLPCKHVTKNRYISCLICCIKLILYLFLFILTRIHAKRFENVTLLTRTSITTSRSYNMLRQVKLVATAASISLRQSQDINAQHYCTHQAKCRESYSITHCSSNGTFTL